MGSVVFCFLADCLKVRHDEVLHKLFGVGFRVAQEFQDGWAKTINP